MAESIQHKLGRVRRPRVHITYDLEIGDAFVRKELPHVMGVIGDYTGTNTSASSLAERKFITIDRDNFHQVLASLNPKLSVKLRAKAGEFKADLSFKHLKDFDPINLVKMIPEMRSSYDKRVYLDNLLIKLDGNSRLLIFLAAVINDKDKRALLQQEIATLRQESTGNSTTGNPVTGSPININPNTSTANTTPGVPGLTTPLETEVKSELDSETAITPNETTPTTNNK